MVFLHGISSYMVLHLEWRTHWSSWFSVDKPLALDMSRNFEEAHHVLGARGLHVWQ